MRGHRKEGRVRHGTGLGQTILCHGNLEFALTNKFFKMKQNIERCWIILPFPALTSFSLFLSNLLWGKRQWRRHRPTAAPPPGLVVVPYDFNPRKKRKGGVRRRPSVRLPPLPLCPLRPAQRQRRRIERNPRERPFWGKFDMQRTHRATRPSKNSDINFNFDLFFFTFQAIGT